MSVSKRVWIGVQHKCQRRPVNWINPQKKKKFDSLKMRVVLQNTHLRLVEKFKSKRKKASWPLEERRSVCTAERVMTSRRESCLTQKEFCLTHNGGHVSDRRSHVSYRTGHISLTMSHVSHAFSIVMTSRRASFSIVFRTRSAVLYWMTYSTADALYRAQETLQCYTECMTSRRASSRSHDASMAV